MTRGRRTALLAALVAGTAVVLAWGLAGLPSFGGYRGPYGIVLDRVAVVQRSATNVPALVNFDYRASDTLGEEFILFSSALGVALLLREPRGEGEEHPPADADEAAPPPAPSALVGAAGRVGGPLVLLVGIYVVDHGWLTPGGGFQGGVILAGAPVLGYLCGVSPALRRVPPWVALEVGGGLGAGGYVAVGLAGIAAGGALYQNVLPLGVPGDLWSGGTLVPANVVVGLEVAAAFTLVVSELADRALILRRRPR